MSSVRYSVISGVKSLPGGSAARMRAREAAAIALGGTGGERFGMTIARANCRAGWCATASSMAPSRRWTCQSSGRRIVRRSGMAIPLIAGGVSRHYLGRMDTWLSDRTLIRIAGDDPRDFLQGLVTSDMRGALPVWAGLLSPQGKALFDFFVWGDGDALLIDCEAAVADALMRRLTMYRLRRAITIEPAPGGVHWSPEGDAGVPDPRLP